MLALVACGAGCHPGLAPDVETEVPVGAQAAGAPACGGHGVDLDRDGLDDACEEALAERFAPVVIHSSAESSFPTDVDAFLATTSLAFRDDGCRAGEHPVLVEVAPTQEGLLHRAVVSPCDGSRVISDSSRSERKHRTFFLTDVATAARAGSADSRRWKTYLHAYPNDLGGVTLQYWRCYAYNHAVGSHGGDWEGVHVVLRADRAVDRVRLLGHRQMEELTPSESAWEGTHPVVYSEVGGHTSRATPEGIEAHGCEDPFGCTLTPSDGRTFVRQETWTGGRVEWPDGRVTPGGGLLNVGEKSEPMNGQAFIRYAGLWGSPGRYYFTSGYWGPAYNETSARPDGFITAWCAGMAGALDPSRECYAPESGP